MIKIDPEVQIKIKAARNGFQVAPRCYYASLVTVYCLSMDDFQTCAPVAFSAVELMQNDDKMIRDLINTRFEKAKRTLLNTDMCKDVWKEQGKTPVS